MARWVVNEAAKTVVYDQVGHEDEMSDTAMNTLRLGRDHLLADSDFSVLEDAPVGTAKQAWKDYRQALRDLPANTPDPAKPVWPVPPA